MNYILNALEDIRKVYTPNIENLNTNNDFLPFAFCGIEKTILESMRFFQYYYYGDDYEKEDLSLKEFNFKNKSHQYRGIDYDYLLRNIDLEVFKTELDKSITNEENHFIFKIKEELDNNNNQIKFIKKLRKDVESLVLSNKNLKSIMENANEFDKILIDRFIVSYKNVYDSLKNEHEQDIVPAVVFKNEYFKVKDDVKRHINANDSIDQTKKTKSNNFDYYTNPSPLTFSLREGVYREMINERKNVINKETNNDLDYLRFGALGNMKPKLAETENTKPEITNPFSKDELKQFILSDFVDEFFKNELKLVKQNYFKNQNTWNKDLKKLVIFCKIIVSRKYTIKPNANMLPKVIKFFEKRYNVNVGDQRKHSKHKDFDLDDNDFKDFEDKSNK